MQNYTSFQKKVKSQNRIVQSSEHFKVTLVTLLPGAVLEKTYYSSKSKNLCCKRCHRVPFIKRNKSNSPFGRIQYP